MTGERGERGGKEEKRVAVVSRNNEERDVERDVRDGGTETERHTDS